MLKKLLVPALFLSVFISTAVYAQTPVPADTTKSWSYNGTTTLNFSQIGLRNWAAGGQNTLSLLGLVNLQAHYNKEKHAWANILEAGYGMQRQGESDAPMRKSDDRLMFLGKYTRKNVIGPIGLVGLLDFRTQFTEGYNYPLDSATNQELPRVKISDFMAPGYLTTSLGFEYRRGESFYIVIAPVSSKFTFVLDDSLSAQGAYGVEKGENMRTEFGATLNTMLQKDIWENVNLQTRVNLFSSYDKPTSIDVNWETLLAFKVNRYITTNISTTLIYDEDITVLRNDGTSGRATQFRYVLALGIGYKFGVVNGKN